MQLEPSAQTIRLYLTLLDHTFSSDTACFFCCPDARGRCADVDTRAKVDTRQRLRDTRGRQHLRHGTPSSSLLGNWWQLTLKRWGRGRRWIHGAQTESGCTIALLQKVVIPPTRGQPFPLACCLEARPKPSRAGATEITEKCAAGKINDFKVAKLTGVCVASARLRASGCVQNLALDSDHVREVTMSWLRLHCDDRAV